MKKLLSIFMVAVAMAGLSGTASAHVTVTPSEAVTADFQTFTVNVPNEKTIATTAVKLIVPQGVKFVTPTQKSGWQITTEKAGSGEKTSILSITWSGGTINEGLRDEFSFNAKTPDGPGNIQWKAYQTYSDGTIVSWDKVAQSRSSDDEMGNSGPASITQVVANPQQLNEQAAAQETGDAAQTTANRSLYVAIVAAAVALLAVFLATRK